MPLPPLPPPGRGDANARLLAALRAEVERLSRIQPAGDLLPGEAGQVLDARQVDIWGRITAAPGGNLYGFVRLVDGEADGSFPDMTGDHTVEGDGVALVAYEVTGRTDVPVGTRVRLHANRLGAGYTFALPPLDATTIDWDEFFSETNWTEFVEHFDFDTFFASYDWDAFFTNYDWDLFFTYFDFDLFFVALLPFLGCGLEVAGGLLRVKKADIAGVAANTGLVPGANCSVAVDLTPDYTWTEDVVERTRQTFAAGNLVFEDLVVEYTNVENAAGLHIDRFESDRDWVTRSTIDPCLFEDCCAAAALSVVATADPTVGYAPLSVDYTATPTGGVGPYTYAWSFPDGTPTSSTAQNPAGITYSMPGGPYTATVTVTDACGRTATDTVDVNVYLYCEEYDAGGIRLGTLTPDEAWEAIGLYVLESPVATSADWVLTLTEPGPVVTVWEPTTPGWDGTGSREFTRTSGSAGLATFTLRCGWGPPARCEEYDITDIGPYTLTEATDEESWNNGGGYPELRSPAQTTYPSVWHLFANGGSGTWTNATEWDGTGTGVFTFAAGSQGGDPTDIDVTCGD